jgi:hypothetical protein
MKRQKRLHSSLVHDKNGYSNDELEFMMAVDRFRNTTGVRFPTLCELLDIIKKLGYEKIDRGPPINGNGSVN